MTSVAPIPFNIVPTDPTTKPLKPPTPPPPPVPVPPVVAPVRVASPTPPPPVSSPVITTTSTAPPTSSQPVPGPSSATSIKSTSTTTSAAGCRLLWRGALLVPTPFRAQHNKPLHGIAIVAHLFSVPSALSPALNSSQPSPFDDPFSSSSSATASGADMCLGLEMMRGGDLKVLGEVDVNHAKISGGKGTPVATNNGKGKGRERVEVETPTDVKVYVDRRCPETTAWFEDTFCREGREGKGVRVEVGGEEVIIFASLPPLPAPSSSPTAEDAPRSRPPPLTLLLGRAIKLPSRAPRPDDPLPRENLFTTKLRRTTSMPVLNLPLPSSKSSSSRPSLLHSRTTLPQISEAPSSTTNSRNPIRPGPLRKSSKILLSLLGKPTSTSSSSSNAALAPPVPPKRTLSRSVSSRGDPFAPLAPPPAKRTFSRSVSSHGDPFAPHHPSRSSSTTTATTTSKRPRIVESPRSSPPPPSSRNGIVPGSPTPSVATTFGGFDDFEEDDDMDDNASFFGERDDEEEGGDGLGSLMPSSFSTTTTMLGKRGRMTRCESAPAGKLLLGGGGMRAGLGVGGATGMRRKREGSEALATSVPPSRATSLAPSEVGGAGGVELKNKATVRKLVLARLTARGVERDDIVFRDVFSLCSKGVQFALRDTFKVSLLDRPYATRLIEIHLGMYLPSLSPSPPVEGGGIIKKEEEVELAASQTLTEMKEGEGGGGMPSPRSLDVVGEEMGGDGDGRRMMEVDEVGGV